MVCILCVLEFNSIENWNLKRNEIKWIGRYWFPKRKMNEWISVTLLHLIWDSSMFRFPLFFFQMVNIQKTVKTTEKKWIQTFILSDTCLMLFCSKIFWQQKLFNLDHITTMNVYITKLLYDGDQTNLSLSLFLISSNSIDILSISVHK